MNGNKNSRECEERGVARGRVREPDFEGSSVCKAPTKINALIDSSSLGFRFGAFACPRARAPVCVRVEKLRSRLSPEVRGELATIMENY